MALLSVLMMPVASVRPLSPDICLRVGVGNEMILVETLARARMRADLMLAVALGELFCRDILPDRKGKRKEVGDGELGG
jgi:hypothetical protein